MFLLDGIFNINPGLAKICKTEKNQISRRHLHFSGEKQGMMIQMIFQALGLFSLPTNMGTLSCLYRPYLHHNSLTVSVYMCVFVAERTFVCGSKVRCELVAVNNVEVMPHAYHGVIRDEVVKCMF